MQPKQLLATLIGFSVATAVTGMSNSEAPGRVVMPQHPHVAAPASALLRSAKNTGDQVPAAHMCRNHTLHSNHTRLLTAALIQQASQKDGNNPGAQGQVSSAM